MKITQTRSYATLMDGLWANNPTFRMILGICSTLAVTNSVRNTIAMDIAVVLVIVFSSLTVSLMRNIIPRRVRMAVYTLIIATYVIFVDQYLRAYYPDISEQIGPYVGLIITNCIIMGRCESFASCNNAWLSVLDAIGVGVGYALSLILIATIRELLGFGSILGFRILGDGWNNWVIMIMSPGAFIVLGVFIWVLRSISKPQPTKSM
ncbi:MAG: electron transport complex subunit RsxE [Candidatus Anammoxibacter sp.]